MSENKTPRGTDWEKDGVGMDDHGNLIIKEEGNTPLWRCATPTEWVKSLERVRELESDLENASRAINAREPDRFLAAAIITLDARSREAGVLSAVGGVAGGIMSGQRQAYADAAAFLRGLTESRK